MHHVQALTVEWFGMSEREFKRKVEQLDRLLNDPEVRMEPDLIWSLLAEVSRADRKMVPLAA